MTENNYERLRDSATGEGAEAWKAADREASNLYALYNELREDARYTVLEWPRLEGDGDHRERVREVLEVLHAGAMEMNGSTRYDVDGYLRWDAKREVWGGSDGFAFDGAGLRTYSRGGGTGA